MYTPKHFAETDTARLLQLVADAPLGTLVVVGSEGLSANHIPFIHRPGAGDGRLLAHIPRANPLSEDIGAGKDCLVVFSGPDGYVTPSWYATKKTHGRVVPTWNYAVTHVHGVATIVDDAAWVMEQINALTEHLEAGRSKPWAVADAPASYTDKLVASLVGIEVAITRVEGKVKASQNQPEQNKASVLEAMAEEQPGESITALMHEVLQSRTD